MSDNEAGRSRRMKFVASIAATLGLLSGALLFAEHDASARTVRIPPSFSVPTVTPPAPVATPQQFPTDLSQAQVLALGSQFAAQGTTAAQTPAQTLDPTLKAITCAALLADRAQTVTSFAALIAQFPALAVPLGAQRAAALAIIDFQLAAFGCIAVPSGVL